MKQMKRAAVYARQRALNVLHGLIARQVDKRATAAQRPIAHAGLDSALQMLGWKDPRIGTLYVTLVGDASKFTEATKEPLTMDPRVTCNRQPTCLAVKHWWNCETLTIR